MRHNQLPTDGTVPLGVLMVILRGQRVTECGDVLLSTDGAAVNTGIGRDRSWGVKGVKDRAVVVY